MEDKKSELLQYAREYATANKDLYDLLSVSADAAQPEVHRAWRKASLKHHPDKAKNFDPEIWQLFERARDVLSIPEARATYDSARAAAAQAQKARTALDAKRRAMIDDLEARERGIKRKAGEEVNGRHMMTKAEKRVLMEKGKEHLEKRQRMKEEAEARERERERTMMEEDKDTTRREAERRPSPPESAQAPTSTSTDTGVEDTDIPQPPTTDEYDERIADLERKLRERKSEKAARKAGKKSNKARRGENPLAGEATTPQTAAERPSPPPKPASTTQHPTSNPASRDFSSTMAKLRAAQREKERKRTEAAANDIVS
ncbi:hypothetical protein EKO27_g3242 [Xylaria grammica]|uniref:J domain-containing protein n=1 Tax=Xylaria grammica TaxID=363999 RepID=A0A439DBU7_9PEZI|nr:hypothetical protein EKO27_g3242 [Xylaria grammica]